MSHHLRTDITRHAQLFLDDSWIDDCGYVERVWHQPRKLRQPVIQPEMPWEDLGLTCYGSVLHWQGKFRAWYTIWPRRQPGVVCYAESDDGVHWQKPELDLHPANDHARTNIVLAPAAYEDGGKIDNLTIFLEPEAEFPLKMIYWDSGRSFATANPQPPPYGLYLAESKDGLHWEEHGVVVEDFGDRFNALPTRHDGKYVLYGRGRIATRKGRPRGRSVYRIESDDLRDWSEDDLILSPDPEDPANLEYYSLMGFPYEGLLIGGIERMHRDPDFLDFELAWSTDSRTWHRSRQRDPFLGWGPPGTWDDQWATLSSSSPILQENRLWFYYSGRSDAHNLPFPHTQAAIGLATLRRDGFCSLFAGEQPGTITTPPITWPEADLIVNVECRRSISSHPTNLLTGDLFVEALDDAGEPIPGFTKDDCDMRRTNTVNIHNEANPELSGYYGITYDDGQRSLRELAGRSIRLTFHLREAHLYAFKAADWEI